MKLAKAVYFIVFTFTVILVPGIQLRAVEFGLSPASCHPLEGGRTQIIEAAFFQGGAKLDWQSVACNDSQLVTPPIMAPAERCSTATVYTPNLTQRSGCRFDHYRAESLSPQEFSFVHALVLNVPYNRACAVPLRPAFATWFPHSLPVLQRAARNWVMAPTIKQDVTGLYFDFPKRHCYAFYFGSAAWRKGYRETYQGFLCGPEDHSALSVDQIRGFLDSLSVRQ